VDMPVQSKGRSSANRWDIREKMARTWRDIGLLYGKRRSTPL
jgi:hypothetical protein